MSKALTDRARALTWELWLDGDGGSIDCAACFVDVWDGNTIADLIASVTDHIAKHHPIVIEQVPGQMSLPGTPEPKKEL